MVVLDLPSSGSSESTVLFAAYGTLLGLAVDLIVYPAEFLKTQLQVSRIVRMRTACAVPPSVGLLASCCCWLPSAGAARMSLIDIL